LTALRPSTLALIACLLLPACSFFEAKPQVRGNAVDPDDLKQLVVGTSTTKDATALLGSPTAHATFDDNTWIYISEVTRTRIGRKLGEDKQNVVVLTFDQSGVLRDVKKLGMDDAQPVQVVSRTTPSPGSEASFLQQLFGNIGRYNPLPGATASGNNGGLTIGGQ
jgi:outer membrane protein assembly factor BamE (lipoprotein component of BamABCDE complex)